MTTESESFQPELPDIAPLPPAHTFTLMTEMEIMGIRKQLIEADGDMEKAGISLEVMRNVIYTCRMKANPMAENDALPKAAKAKKEKTESTNKLRLSGDDVNSFLG